MTAKHKMMAYWTTTGVLVLAMLSGAAAELTRQKDTVAGMVFLGYPVYFIMILGFWKMLGAVALITPRFPLLKEWAYADIFFNMTGAALSHAICGDAAWHIAVTLGFAVLAMLSWALRPESRKLEILR